MSIKRPVHQSLRRGRSAIALVLGAIGLLPAAALAQQVIPPGHIIITRDVGPRNALTPEVGLRYSLATAPDPDELAFDGQVTAITDAQASEISGTVGIATNIGSTLQGSLDLLGGSEQIGGESLLGQSSGGFIGDTVNGAISGSMSALSNVLSALPLAAP